MPTITLRGVSKTYGGHVNAVQDLDLTIPDGAFMCLLGPSGCGKTTTLRMIAGLEHPTAGELMVGDRVLDSVARGRFVPPEQRQMGLVFQNYALWPHLTVNQNIEFGMAVRKVSKSDRDKRVAELLTLLQIEGVGSRYPSQLSGGQQQRVALARMLAVNPTVLLLDEPLSNLDARLRLEMRAELKRLHERLGNTIVFVTHDQLEAMTMATQVAVMHNGRLQQLAPPMDIYRRPANLFVAEFVGNPTINLVALDRPTSATMGRSLLDGVRVRDREAADAAQTVGIRPEAVRIVQADDDAWWTYPARIETILPTGPEWIVRLQADGVVISMLASREPRDRPGDDVTIGVAASDVHLFDAAGARIGATIAAGNDEEVLV